MPTKYTPGTRFVKAYLPSASVVVVSSALVFASYSVTVTFDTPGSARLWMPSPSASSHTKSPSEAGWYRPASHVGSLSPDASVVSAAAPVTASISLSTMSSAPWSCGLTYQPAGTVTRT